MSNFKKIFLFVFFFIFLILISLFFFPKKTQAEGSYFINCLNIVNTYKPSCKGNFPCQDFPADFDINLIGGKRDHTAKIEGEGFPEGKDIYIVGCISTPTGPKCTTGDSALNQKVNQIGFSTVDSPDYFFKAAQNPVKPVGGKVSVIVRSATPKGEDHIFFGVAEVSVQEYGGEGKTVQYGTFGFTTDLSKCIGIYWDPKGRVFDSISLEPLPLVTVTLLDKEKNFASILGVKNPVETKEDGLFNFFVPNGDYYLKPEKANYQFPLTLSEVNINYSKAYYCDVKVGYPLYYDQHKIIERNEIIHCDVPLKPLGEPFKSEPILLDYIYFSSVNGYKVQGRFSHPLTIVQFKQENKLIKEINSDKFGNWNAVIPYEEISSESGQIKVIGIKNKTLYPLSSVSSFNFLNKIFNKIFSWLNKAVLSQTQEEGKNILVLEPILRHLEGYVYDQEGRVIPLAKVKIITQMNKKVYFETEADDKGFFRIYSNQLPIFPYYIEFSSPLNSSLKIVSSTSQFVKNNQSYLKENKINLINATKNDQPISTSSSAFSSRPNINLFPSPNNLTPTEKVDSFTFPSNLSPSPVSQINKEEKNFFENKLLIIMGILLILIVLVGVIIFIYLKKKKTEIV